MSKIKAGKVILSLITLYVLWAITGSLLESIIKNAIIERKARILDGMDEIRRKVYNL